MNETLISRVLVTSVLFASAAALAYGADDSYKLQQGSLSNRSVLDLNKSKEVQTVVLAENPAVQASLINLSPATGSWYILDVSGGALRGSYHLEIVNPAKTKIKLTPRGVQISTLSSSSNVECDLFSGNSDNNIKTLSQRGRAFARLCGQDVSLRLKSDRNAIDSDIAQALFAQKAPTSATSNLAPNGALVRAGSQEGSWIPSRYQGGVYFSTLHPNQVAPEILASRPDRADALGTEASATVSLVAMSLDQFTVGWGHGPLLPGVGHWSKMSPFQTSADQAGPDGFQTLSPLVTNGMLNPLLLPKLAATMCGGFQRYHGWMRAGGPHAGKYYGFVEEGVVLSTLSEGLTTFIVYNDGSIDLKKWESKDLSQLSKIRYARQNGVSIAELDPASGQSIPGALVSRSKWRAGNWSGSGNAELVTPRSGVCLAKSGDRKYLIYGYFSSASPSSMARVFQSYGCVETMHLDMNSAGKAYFGLFEQHGNQFVVEHPSSAMAEKDSVLMAGAQSIKVPRFVGKPDSADPGDFFYFLKKDEVR